MRSCQRQPVRWRAGTSSPPLASRSTVAAPLDMASPDVLATSPELCAELVQMILSHPKFANLSRPEEIKMTLQEVLDSPAHREPSLSTARKDELVAMVLRRGGSPEQKTVPELRELLKELDPTLCPRPKAEIPGLNRMKKGDLILLAQSRRIDPTGMNADQIRLALTGSKVVMPLPTPTTGTSSKNVHRPLRGYCLSCPECRQPMRREAADGREFWACPSPECDPQKEWAMM